VRSRSPFFLPALESSLALPVGAVLALIWANTAEASYEHFAHVAEFSVNDVGMVFFFALAAKEVVEAMAPGGALHTWRRAVLRSWPQPVAWAALALSTSFRPSRQRAVAPARGRFRVRNRHRLQLSDREGDLQRHPAIPFLPLPATPTTRAGVLAVFYPVGELHDWGALLMAAALVSPMGCGGRTCARSGCVST
jgi:hypothetical protein